MVDGRKEAVFLPYKASMWDSLESVWRAADRDPEYDAYVVPIPYFDRNPDGSEGEWHYEGGMFPEGVPVTDYRDYDIGERRPDLAFIHYPYDGMNRVTGIPPEYYSARLAHCAGRLVYIPYFVLQEPDTWHDAALDDLERFVILPGVMNAHRTVVQSEHMREGYIRVLARRTGRREEWEGRILGIGSPKFDAAPPPPPEELPEEWRRRIVRPDGTMRKVVFYNTTVSEFQAHGALMLRKMRDVFAEFGKHREEAVLLWRPHPLTAAALRATMPGLAEEYEALAEEYRRDGPGIYDDSPDFRRAVAVCDCYYGGHSSVMEMFKESGRPAMTSSPYILYNDGEDG